MSGDYEDICGPYFEPQRAQTPQGPGKDQGIICIDVKRNEYRFEH